MPLPIRRVPPLLALLLLAPLGGCAPWRHKVHQKWEAVTHPSDPSTARGRAVIKAQQAAYDRGVQFFSEEKYPEAEQAWRQAADYDPSSPVGQKAQDHLAEVDKIIKSLTEIDRQ